MSTAEHPAPAAMLPPLVAGQRMNRVEFHDRYEAMPPGTTFELIDGVVRMASPVGPRHGKQGLLLSGWLLHYMALTPGVVGYENASVALDGHSEVQPDLTLRVDSGPTARSRETGTIISGSPELIVEVADSTRASDLGAKRRIYDQSRCQEYLVHTLDPLDIHWHARRDGRLVRVPPDADGVYRSLAFPGLWLDQAALLARDIGTLLATLGRGLESPEHAAFVARLATAADPAPGGPA